MTAVPSSHRPTEGGSGPQDRSCGASWPLHRRIASGFICLAQEGQKLGLQALRTPVHPLDRRMLEDRPENEGEEATEAGSRSRLIPTAGQSQG